MTTTTQKRYAVVDRDGAKVIRGMHRLANAEDEAEELNRTGLEECRPYTVIVDDEYA